MGLLTRPRFRDPPDIGWMSGQLLLLRELGRGPISAVQQHEPAQCSP